MGSRNPEKEMKKRYGALETFSRLVQSALKSSKTKSKKLVGMKKELQDYFMSLDEAFRLYKDDIMEKDAKSHDIFNGKDESDKDNYPYNDGWSESVMEKYLVLSELLEEKIDELEDGEVAHVEDKPAVQEENPEYLDTEVESEKASLHQSINAFANEVNDKEELTLSSAGAMEKFSEKLKNRLELLRYKSRKVKDKLRTEINDFCNTETAKLDSVLLQICT